MNAMSSTFIALSLSLASVSLADEACAHEEAILLQLRGLRFKADSPGSTTTSMFPILGSMTECPEGSVPIVNREECENLTVTSTWNGNPEPLTTSNGVWMGVTSLEQRPEGCYTHWRGDNRIWFNDIEGVGHYRHPPLCKPKLAVLGSMTECPEGFGPIVNREECENLAVTSAWNGNPEPLTTSNGAWMGVTSFEERPHGCYTHWQGDNRIWFNDIQGVGHYRHPPICKPNPILGSMTECPEGSSPILDQDECERFTVTSTWNGNPEPLNTTNGAWMGVTSLEQRPQGCYTHWRGDNRIWFNDIEGVGHYRHPPVCKAD